MEYQIGQQIEINGRHNMKLVVCEHKNCDGCFFIYKCKAEDRNTVKSVYGECSCMERKDEKNIIFKPVSDNSISYDVEKTRVKTPLYYQGTDLYDAGSELFFVSDLHFCHDREFIWKARGFASVLDMNMEIVKRWNETVSDKADVYVIGDLMLGGPDSNGIEYIRQLKGYLHIITGNHDTDKRVEQYKSLPNVISVTHAAKVRYDGYNFLLTHMPCLTGNLEKKSIRQMTINLSGHTHSNRKFFYDLPYVYNVAADAHECRPVHVDTIIKDIHDKIKECEKQL